MWDIAVLLYKSMLCLQQEFSVQFRSPPKEEERAVESDLRMNLCVAKLPYKERLKH